MTKDTIKSWLKQHTRTRHWLADQCGVAVGTVNNWLSTSIAVPDKALRIIDSLMEEDNKSAQAAAPPKSHLILRLSTEEFTEWNRASLLQGKLIEDWAIDAIRAAYEEDQKKGAKQKSVKGV